MLLIYIYSNRIVGGSSGGEGCLQVKSIFCFKINNWLKLVYL